MSNTSGLPEPLVDPARIRPPWHGTPGWALFHGPAFNDGDRAVRKATPESFPGTGLDAQLRQAGVAAVALRGHATEFRVGTPPRRAAAAQIVAHHNATLPEVSSFDRKVRAVPAADTRFRHALWKGAGMSGHERRRCRPAASWPRIP